VQAAMPAAAAPPHLLLPPDGPAPAAVSVPVSAVQRTAPKPGSAGATQHIHPRRVWQGPAPALQVWGSPCGEVPCQEAW
jgi:hypothetical protein